MNRESLPTIIQGGMGVGISAWRLARAVSITGQLGVVSGTSLDSTLIRRLQLGDPGGHMRRALKHFPLAEVAERILDRYFIPGGKAPDKPFRSRPLPVGLPGHQLDELCVAGNFVEVFLAKEGHEHPVGVNYLEKVQFPTLPSIYGAMLADVDWVLMGAGIPRTIPGILDRLANGEPVELKLDVKDVDRGEEFLLRFDPREFFGGDPPQLKRPKFLAIISSSTLATMLIKRSTGKIDGFVVEGATAGGHNAPPRGKLQLTEDGEPIYGDRDAPNLPGIKALGLPFWLAGSYGEPDRVADALLAGATGVQVGTAFAFCEESGLDPDLKKRVVDAARSGEVCVYTDPVASPTGFPFKIAQLDGTISDDAVYKARTRVCDLAYLRHAYKKEDGSLGWRCPAEPVSEYVRKNGDEEDTHGRKCICNGLVANIGLGQLQRNGDHEKPLITTGNDVTNVVRYLDAFGPSYRARDVVEYLLGGVTAPVCAESTSYAG